MALVVVLVSSHSHHLLTVKFSVFFLASATTTISVCLPTLGPGLPSSP